MNLQEQKEELKKYKDLYGNLLQDFKDIDNASNEMYILDILHNHECHLEECLKDALSSLGRLKEKIKLFK